MNDNVIFPVGLDVEWSEASVDGIPDPHLQNWLLHTGSLTERLQAHCRQFTLTLLGQATLAVSQEEAVHVAQGNGGQGIGKTAGDEQWQIREVILSGDGKPWVFARSLLPQRLCEGDLASLGKQPLGKRIFNDESYKRSKFEVCKLVAGHPLQQQLGVSQDFCLWGRRSLFFSDSQVMSVAEVFLPDAPAYKHMNYQ